MDRTLHFKKNLNIFYIILCIIYPAISLYITHIDGAHLFLKIFFILSLFFNFQYKGSWLSLISIPNIFWELWLLYAILSIFLINGFNDDEIDLNIFIFNIINPFYCYLLISDSKIHIQKVLKLLIYILTFLMLLILSFDQYVLSPEGIRFGKLFGINEVAATANLSAIIALIAFQLKAIKRNFLIIAEIIFTFSAIITGSKKSFIIAILILFFLFVNLSENINKIKRFAIITIGFISIILMYFIFLSDSIAVKRIMLTIDEALSGGNKFGDRGDMYLASIELFSENPITGIGLRNYMYFTGSKVALHSEYMVQLAECGIIGTCLYLAFYINNIKRIFKFHKIRKYKPIANSLLLGIVTILILSSAAWVYDSLIVFIFFGICAKLCNDYEK